MVIVPHVLFLADFLLYAHMVTQNIPLPLAQRMTIGRQLDLGTQGLGGSGVHCTTKSCCWAHVWGGILVRAREELIGWEWSLCKESIQRSLIDF